MGTEPQRAAAHRTSVPRRPLQVAGLATASLGTASAPGGSRCCRAPPWEAGEGCAMARAASRAPEGGHDQGCFRHGRTRGAAPRHARGVAAGRATRHAVDGHGCWPPSANGRACEGHRRAEGCRAIHRRGLYSLSAQRRRARGDGRSSGEEGTGENRHDFLTFLGILLVRARHLILFRGLGRTRWFERTS